MSEKLRILIDGDVVIFLASLDGEKTTVWQEAYTDSEGIHQPALVDTVTNSKKAIASLKNRVKFIVLSVLNHMEYDDDQEYEVTMALSDRENFRKTLYPEYKANRAGKAKPLLYEEVRAYVESNYCCDCRPTLEADDVLGILATTHANSVVCSIDKDMATIPNIIFFNFQKETFLYTTTESAHRYHLCQTLTGDTADNYKGCPSIGPKKANAALDEECSWEKVVKVFASKGLTEEDALLQARVAKILTADLWKDGQVMLWSPYAQTGNLMIIKEGK